MITQNSERQSLLYMVVLQLNLWDHAELALIVERTTLCPPYRYGGDATAHSNVLRIVHSFDRPM